jgi:predicted ATPase
MAEVKKIEIRGFRSLRDVSWEPARLNVLIGPNGAGKSNLLWALEFLRQSANGKLREAILSEGSFRQVLWDHQAGELAWKVELVPEPLHALIYDLALSNQLSWEGGFYINRETLNDYHYSKGNGDAFKLIDRDLNRAAISDSDRKLVEIPEKLDDDQSVLSERFPFGIFHLMVFRLALRSFRIYHDLVTHKGAVVREAAVARVEKSLSPDGQNLVPVLHTHYSDRNFKRDIDGAMRAAFGDEFEELVFAPAADQKVQLRIRWKSLRDPVSSADLSDGTLRFLMLVTALADPLPPTLIAIDEPETNLHPRMFPIIAEFPASASEHSTVIFSTHSPEFLDAFPADCIPTTTVAECIDGETKLSRLDPADLKRWLKEYSLGKLFKSGELEALS